MAKTTFRFKKNKVRVSPALSKRQKRFRWILTGILSLVLVNYAWDGYKRQKDLYDTYGQAKEYYDIIANETVKSFTNIKKQIDTLDNNKKE